MPRGTTVKSERTRAAIASAASALFRHRGYDSTTIRDIAAKAGTDPALVIRYFKNKENLFAEVAEPRLDLPPLGDIDPELIGDTLIRRFLEIWEGEDSGMPILLRSAASNEAAANRLREIFATQVLPTIAAVGPRQNVAQRAGLISSQLLGLALTRYVLKLPPAVALERDTIVREVGRVIQGYATIV
jgi:AcrR family transcriptional regulator